MSSRGTASRLSPLAGIPEDALVIHEVYASIQGESTYAGLPCVFVRTTACHLRCRYCDTGHAFLQGTTMTLTATEKAVRALGCPLVEVTGGEPLLQPAVLPLMSRLCDAGYKVLLETSGTLDVACVDPRVVKVMDLKSPSSGEVEHNCYDNVAALTPIDEVKLVLSDRADYEWARDIVQEHDLTNRCTVLMSSVFGALEPASLAAWILEDRLKVRLQLQLHKFIWDPKARGV